MLFIAHQLGHRVSVAAGAAAPTDVYFSRRRRMTHVHPLLSMWMAAWI